VHRPIISDIDAYLQTVSGRLVPASLVFSSRCLLVARKHRRIFEGR